MAVYNMRQQVPNVIFYCSKNFPVAFGSRFMPSQFMAMADANGQSVVTIIIWCVTSRQRNVSRNTTRRILSHRPADKPCIDRPSGVNTKRRLLRRLLYDWVSGLTYLVFTFCVCSLFLIRRPTPPSYFHVNVDFVGCRLNDFASHCNSGRFVKRAGRLSFADGCRPVMSVEPPLQSLVT